MISCHVISTVKPLYSGHHLRFIEVCPKLAYFASKTLPMVLGYGEVDLKKCQENFWEKEYKGNTYIKYFIFRYLRLTLF